MSFSAGMSNSLVANRVAGGREMDRKACVAAGERVRKSESMERAGKPAT
jgi:hypothetical protein